MDIGLILLIIVILLLIGAVPAWPYSRGWGYRPASGIAILLVILIILAFSGHVVLSIKSMIYYLDCRWCARGYSYPFPLCAPRLPDFTL